MRIMVSSRMQFLHMSLNARGTTSDVRYPHSTPDNVLLKILQRQTILCTCEGSTITWRPCDDRCDQHLDDARHSRIGWVDSLWRCLARSSHAHSWVTRHNFTTAFVQLQQAMGFKLLESRNKVLLNCKVSKLLPGEGAIEVWEAIRLWAL